MWIGSTGDCVERNRGRKAGRYLPASPLTTSANFNSPFPRPGSPVFTIGYPMPNPMREEKERGRKRDRLPYRNLR